MDTFLIKDFYMERIPTILFHLNVSVDVSVSLRDGVAFVKVDIKFDEILTRDDRNVIKQRLMQEFPKITNVKWLEAETKIYEIDNGVPKMRMNMTQHSFTFEAVWTISGDK